LLRLAASEKAKQNRSDQWPAKARNQLSFPAVFGLGNAMVRDQRRARRH
jgi:hypothetical protein